MKRVFHCTLVLGVLFAIPCQGQEVGDAHMNTSLQIPDDNKEMKEVKRKVDEAVKELKREEKAKKETEREEKLEKAIADKKKSIEKGAQKITRLQEKLSKGESKGKLSPRDTLDIHMKLIKLKKQQIKNQEKLAKLKKRR